MTLSLASHMKYDLFFNTNQTFLICLFLALLLYIAYWFSRARENVINILIEVKNIRLIISVYCLARLSDIMRRRLSLT